MPAAGFVARTLGLPELSLATLGLYAVVSLAGLAVAFWAWPGLGRVLLTYAFAARIPVVLVMLFAILGHWGTHYDVLPTGAPEMPPFPKWLAHRRPSPDDDLALVHRGDRRAVRDRGRRDRRPPSQVGLT